jgi:hypothetical protein
MALLEREPDASGARHRQIRHRASGERVQTAAALLKRAQCGLTRFLKGG